MGAAEATPNGTARGLTVADVAQRYRVGRDRVRGWIRRGELAAINTADALLGRPRWVITAESLAAFEARRTAAPAPPPPRRRRRPAVKDYFTDF